MSTVREKVGFEQPANVLRIDRTVCIALAVDDNFYQRLQPAHPARTIAPDDDVDTARLRFSCNRSRDLLRSDGERGGIPWDIDERAHVSFSRAAISASKRSVDTRPWSSSS